MSWATHAIEQLKRGETVKMRPRGNSMTGKIESGELVTIEPLTEAPEKDDIVLCRVAGSDYLHLVKAVNGDRFLIGNNRGRLNGWTGRASIFGKVTKVEA
jgi:phage repressor protein C with HTH and peptisase S24 domain